VGEERSPRVGLGVGGGVGTFKYRRRKGERRKGRRCGGMRRGLGVTAHSGSDVIMIWCSWTDDMDMPIKTRSRHVGQWATGEDGLVMALMA
jgi:hypothetical protein